MKHFILFIFVSIFFVPAANSQRLQAMDLGLSVKWANMNVGASAPEEYGEYFAWGEVKPKRYYGAYSKYKHFYNTPEHGIYYKKYNYYRYKNKSKVDSLLTLTKGDDVASTEMGGKWRMPTETEMKELIEKCIFIFAIYKNTKGFFVTNRTELSDTIFLPLVGYKDFGNFRFHPAKEGNYWTSTLIGNEVHDRAAMVSIDPRYKLNMHARCLILSRGEKPIIDFLDRRTGCAIRAVTDEKK